MSALAKTCLLAAFVCLFCACGEAPDQAAGSGDGGGARASAAVAGFPASTVRVSNVILITIDTLRADALSFAGNERIETPVLDRLAATGRVYTNAHAHNVVTLPSHANILTGLNPFQHGVRDNAGFVLPETIPTAATHLGESGFATGAVVGAFVLDARFGLDRGFDLYDDRIPRGASVAEAIPAERSGLEVVERGLSWWRDHAGERRFLWLHLFDPHAPYEAPEPFGSRYPNDPYLAQVAAIDAYLAPLLNPLLNGDEESTLVVFTSDHGEALGDHGERTHGVFAYESTLAVPLVLWAPGLEPGRSPEAARHIDLLPTILEATGEAVPDNLPGRSLLSGPGSSRETYFEALTATLDRGWAPLRGLLSEGDKLISLPLPELYRLEDDPGEQRNLFTEKRDRAAELARRLPIESVWPPERGDVGEDALAALRGLGYLGGDASSRKSYTEADDPKRLIGLDSKMHRVVDLYQRRRLPEAADLAREVIGARPDMAVAHYYLGQVLLEAGRLGEAIAVMEAAYRSGAVTAALVRQLGLSLSEAGEFDRALAVLRPAAEAGTADDWNALGLVLSQFGRQEEARRALARALESDPENAVSHQHLAVVALNQGKWKLAETESAQAVELDPSLDLAWNYLGTARHQLGRSAAAVDAWERAVAVQPRNFDALYNLALVASQLGQRERAVAAWREFLASAPRDRYGADMPAAQEWLKRLSG